MSISLRTLTVLLMAAGVFVLAGCGDGESTDESHVSETGDVSISVVSHPDVQGWMELSISEAPPMMSRAGDTSVWLLFDGGNLLEFSTDQARWKAWNVNELGVIIDITVDGDIPVLLTDGGVHAFNLDRTEMTSEALPEGFMPVDVESRDGSPAVLSASGDIAVLGEEGFEVYSPENSLVNVSGLQYASPDWVFSSDEGIAMLDPSVSLWQYEESPDGGLMVAADNVLFTGVGDTVFARTAPGEWEYHAEGRLYQQGLLLTDAGITSVSSPEVVLADLPSFQPIEIISMKGGTEPFWAMDERGAAVYTQLGSVETNLPYYETERVSCSLAGQGSGGMQGSTDSIEEMIMAGSGTFRIYESVSIRPDPFTEFSTTGHDARRDLESISIEEFRLVGITMDPVGGDQALVEDGLGVPYVLYEGTILAYNSHVAEITSNEVIVIQDVIVDYSARGGGETTIPTIYSLRLHEEGGL